jgi:sugar phosphate isomerase/epimerase
MSRLQLAIPTAVFRQPLRPAIELAARLRPDGVQFDLRSELTSPEFGDSACRQLRHFVAEQRLLVGAATYSTAGALVEPDRLDARVAGIRQALELARRIGSPVLTVRLGQIPQDAASRAAERLGDVLRDLAQHADHVGTRLAVSTLGNSVSDLQSLISAAGVGPVGVDFDPAGFVFAGESPIAALRGLADLLAHVQIRDGERAADGLGVETAIGEGRVVWDELLATVLETDFAGWLTVRRTGGTVPVDDIRQVLTRLRTWVR